MQIGIPGQISQQAASIPNPAIDAEEINILLSARIPECRKMLAESSTCLQQVADYCEDNYKNVCYFYISSIVYIKFQFFHVIIMLY